MCAGWCGIIGIDCRTELAGFRIQNYFMADQKTIAVYDSQVDNYVETINKAPVDEMLLDFISQFKPDDLILIWVVGLQCRLQLCGNTGCVQTLLTLR